MIDNSPRAATGTFPYFRKSMREVKRDWFWDAIEEGRSEEDALRYACMSPEQGKEMLDDLRAFAGGDA